MRGRFLSLLFFILILSGCGKELIVPLNGGKPILAKSLVTDIQIKSAILSGEVLNEGTSKVFARGFYLNDLSSNSQNVKKINLTGALGKFEITTDLKPNTNYSFYGFAVNTQGESIENPIPFLTGDYKLPTISNEPAKNISFTTVELIGSVVDEGGGTVSESGFVMAINSLPTTNDLKFAISKGKGALNVIVTKLNSNTKYFCRAFAINEKGVNYSNEQNFTTLDFKLPTITTNVVTTITDIGGEVGGQVLDDGGNEVIERGVCIGINPNPEIKDNKIIIGSGKGQFSTTISNLKASTTYYIRAYAINSKGVAYGNQNTFTTKAFVLPSTISVNHRTINGVSPIDVSITYKIYWSNASGKTKGWITQNLGASREALSANEKSINSSGWYFQFNRKQGYQSDEFTRIPDNAPWVNLIQEDNNWLISSDPCKLELGGKWRLPTITEWSEERNSWLEAFISPMKITSSAYLSSDGGKLSQWGISGNYWSSTQRSPSIGWYLGGGGPSYYDRYDNKSLAMPCRCVMDLE